MSHGHNGSLVSPSDHKSLIEPLELAFGFSCTVGRFAQKRPNIRIGFTGSAAFSFSRRSPDCQGQMPAQEQSRSLLPNLVMSTPISAINIAALITSSPGMVCKSFHSSSIRLHGRDDLSIDHCYLSLEPFHVPRYLLQNQSMSITDLALKRQLQEHPFSFAAGPGLFRLFAQVWNLHLMSASTMARADTPSMSVTTQPKRIPASSRILWSRFFSAESIPLSFRR